MIRNLKSQKKIGRIPLIVIVDDDESIRDSIQSLTRSVGFRTEVFPSAEKLLDSDLLHDTDCLILDVRMEGMSGLQLQQRLNEMGSKIPIIFITAHHSEQRRLHLGRGYSQDDRRAMGGDPRRTPDGAL